MAPAAVNPLLTTAKPSDSPLTIKLHPLVLLTITDFITRHTLTAKEGPIAGAVIGQLSGRNVTLEHAFESALKPKPGDDGRDRVIMDEPWFGDRLAQYKEVHANPPLDLVAAFTLSSTKGPAPEHVPMVQQLKANYNDDTLLILFHPETVLDGSLTGGKLPITIYESFYEPGTENGDKGLQVDGWGVGRQLQLKFRQLPFEVETGEAEMIGVDYVAKGAANANIAVDASRKQSVAASTKGKEKAAAETTDDSTAEHVLSAEDEELIASLTSKANAIKMLQSRVGLIRSYLASQPQSYLTDPSLAPSSDPALNHPLLRQISSLLSRLPLLAPPSLPGVNAAAPNGNTSTKEATEANNVALTSLMATLTATLASTREMGQKVGVVNRAKENKRAAGQARGGMGDGPPGMQGGRFGGGGRSGGGGGVADGLDGGFDSGADGVDEEY